MSSRSSETASFTARDFNSAFYEQFDPDEATKGQAPPDDMLGAYDTVQKFVPEFDTPSMPALTFRSLFLGCISTISLSVFHTIFSFRTSPTFDVTPFMVVIACYPIGIFMANTLPIRTFTLPRMPFSKSLYPPTFTLNPGPFSVKEHTLIFVFASTATVSSYGMGNIIAQKYILGMDIHDIWCFLFLLVSQFNGYGLTGLFRKFLVRPSSMLWPQCLTVVSFMNTFHEEVYGRHEPDGVTDKLNARLPNGPRLSRFAFFWTAGAVMFLWQFLPSFIAPFLSAVSVLCLFNVGNEKLKLMGSAAQGVGFLSVTFDWSIISSVGPINSPFWALVNNVVGSWIFLWVVTPLLWATNTFGSDSLLGADPVYGANGTGMFPLGSALNSYNLFDKDSNLLPIRSLLDPATNTTLDLAFYDSVKPVRMSTVFAVSYMSKFLCITATVVHVALWYGADIVHRFKTAARDLDTEDIHAKLMDVYAEVPDSWYWMLLFVNSVIGLSVCQWGGFALPWWGVLLSTTLALVLFLPLGIIRAISGQVFGINVLAEMVGGYMFPGQMISVLTYKSLTTMSLEQGMLLIQDLKFGHYMKIPPRDLFWTQFIATFLTAASSYLTTATLFRYTGDKILGGIEGWTATLYQTFFTTGAIWGAVGPERFFGVGSPYHSLLYCFAIGAVLPIFPYAFFHFGWGNWWCLVNIPLIVTLSDEVGALHSDMITPLIVGFFINVIVRKYYSLWWDKFAYIITPAFDNGASMALIIVFALRVHDIRMPFYLFNRIDPEMCSPDYFMTCVEHMITQGASYNSSTDIPVCQTFGMAGM